MRKQPAVASSVKWDYLGLPWVPATGTSLSATSTASCASLATTTKRPSASIPIRKQPTNSLHKWHLYDSSTQGIFAQPACVNPQLSGKDQENAALIHDSCAQGEIVPLSCIAYSRLRPIRSCLRLGRLHTTSVQGSIGIECSDVRYPITIYRSEPGEPQCCGKRHRNYG